MPATLGVDRGTSSGDTKRYAAFVIPQTYNVERQADEVVTVITK
jgi:hypothetical protein